MKLISCVFNFDTANVDLLFDDGSSLVIDCAAIENQYGTTMRRRSELDWLMQRIGSMSEYDIDLTVTVMYAE